MAGRENSANLRVWVLTDGKAGDDVQCLGVASQLAPSFEKRVIAPRKLWAMTAPWGPIDWRDRPSVPSSPIAPPFPDVLVASGRRAIPYGRHVKRASNGKTFVVLLKDPRIALRHADLIWAPSHDRLQGPNVVSTLTSPHGLADSLAQAKEIPNPVIAKLRGPLLGVVLGGPSGGARYDVSTAKGLARIIIAARAQFPSVAITPSRRTPPDFVTALKQALGGPDPDLYVWDGKSDNPYVDILAQADALIVTADSHNMMSEAVATGHGVYAFRPPGFAKKLAWFVHELEELGAVRSANGAIEPYRSAPIDATVVIADEIRSRLSATRP